MKNTEKKSDQNYSGCLFIGIIMLLCYIDKLEHKSIQALPITTVEIQERLHETKAYIAILTTIDYYKSNVANNGYNQNAAHLLQVWNFCQTYAPIVTDMSWIDQLLQPEIKKERIRADIKAIDMPLLMFCICGDESAFHPNAVYTNKNKTQDSGITQINQECQQEINQLLPKDLQARPWTDTEKNIVGRYIWIMQRAKSGMAWDIMTRQRGWKLYMLISKKIKNFKPTQEGINE